MSGKARTKTCVFPECSFSGNFANHFAHFLPNINLSRLKQKIYSSPMNGDHRASSLRASRFRQRPQRLDRKLKY